MTRRYRITTTFFASALLLVAGCASSPDAGSSSGDQSESARAYTRLASDFLRQGDLGRAQEFFTKALNYDPGRFNALWGLAVTYNRQGRTERAASYYQQAISVKTTARLLNSYGAFVCQQGNTDKAIALFERAADDPTYSYPGVPLANAGLCYLKSGRTERAVAYFQRALGKNQNQPLALTQMAKLALRRGNALRARAYLKRVEQTGELGSNQLKLAARIALAAGDLGTARRYVDRYNETSDGRPLSIARLRRTGS